MGPILVDVPTFCNLLGIRKTKAFELLRDPRIRSVRIGAKRLVLVESVLAYVASLDANAEHAELGERR